jgi:hypothetical protein
MRRRMVRDAEYWDHEGHSHKKDLIISLDNFQSNTFNSMDSSAKDFCKYG